MSVMRRLGLLAVLVLLAGGALLRFASLTNANSAPSRDADAIRQLVHSRDIAAMDSPDESFRRLGVERIITQVYDPGAIIVMQSGPDQQPGRADSDDNRNGRVDERSELGATGSDDALSVIGAADQDSLSVGSTLRLGRGAFVTTTGDKWAAAAGQRTRIFVIGKTGDEGWSFMVE